MKTILALALFGAAALLARGEEFYDESAHPAPPKFFVACMAKRKICKEKAGNDCEVLECLKRAKDCLKKNAPEGHPELPGPLKGCLAQKLRNCKKLEGCGEKLRCVNCAKCSCFKQHPLPTPTGGHPGIRRFLKEDLIKSCKGCAPSGGN